MNISDLLSERTEMINAHLAKNLSTPEPLLETLYDSMRYSALSGGKRIRPFLVLEFCRLFGGRDDAAVDFACAIEYVHASSLVHDDMPCMDNDDMRRGRPTNHKVYGEDIALLCGDALITRGYEMAARNKRVSAETALAATAMLLREAGAVGMMGGQEIDLLSEGKKTDFKTLMSMHEKKTGALIKASCLLGTMAAGITDEDDERYKAAVKYAYGIGISFQITDDILDVEGDAELMGKATHADAALEKTTFLTFMDTVEARAYAEKLTTEAIEAIAPYEGNETLTELARYLLCRNK
jgi:geranylgeranyl diphosphate synthase type II